MSWLTDRPGGWIDVLLFAAAGAALVVIIVVVFG
jgi:hypothetical protein